MTWDRASSRRCRPFELVQFDQLVHGDAFEDRLSQLIRSSASHRVRAKATNAETAEVGFALTLQGRGHRPVVSRTVLLDVDRGVVACAQCCRVRCAEKMLGQPVEYVDAVHAIVFTNRQVHGHEQQLVRLGNTQRWLEIVDEVGQLIVPNELRTGWIEKLPFLVVHVVIIVGQALKVRVDRLVREFRRLFTCCTSSCA